MGKEGVDNRADRDLEERAQVFCALRAENQSSSRPGGPIGSHPSEVEEEPQSYRATCDSTHRDPLMDPMRKEFQGLVENDRFHNAIDSIMRSCRIDKSPYSLNGLSSGRPIMPESSSGRKLHRWQRDLCRRRGQFSADFSSTPAPSSTGMIGVSELARF